MNSVPDDEAAWLRQYDPTKFPPFAVAVDLAMFTLRSGELCALLVRRAEPPFRDRWALPGGHMLQGKESADDAARRELLEETGLDASESNVHLEQLATYSAPDRDPRMAAGLQVVSIAYFALAPNLPDAVAGTDARQAEWTPVSESRNLAFDHDRILRDALERIRSKLEYTTLALHFVEDPFSIADLRHVYEAVWNRPLDPANFRRKILATPDLVLPTDSATASPGRQGGRPPELYRRGSARFMVPALYRPE